MLKFIWRTDVHFADKTPKRRTGSWRQDVSDKLKWIGTLAQEINADCVIDGGDFFDVKSPVKNSHLLVREACDIHNDYPCPTYALVGNHDVKYGQIEYLPEQPLGVLFSAGVFKRFGDEEEVIFQKDGLKVRLVGVPYHGVVYDFDRLRNIKKKDEDYLIVACHLLARKGNTGSMFEGEDIVGYNFLNTISEVDVWCFGHWHKDQGIEQLDNGSWVINTGSLTRGALHLDDLDRNPCVVEITLTKEGVSLNRHNVKMRDAYEVFKIEQATSEKQDKDRMEEIVEKMKSLASASDKGLTLRDKVLQLQVPQKVKEVTLAYLEDIDQ